jgi:hypothetical protein
LYDEDVCDEEVLIEWASKESKKYVSKEMSKKIHEKVAPFIKWLKEAEVEEGEDEDEEKKGNNGEAGEDEEEDESEDEEKGEEDENGDDDDDDDMFEFSHRVSGIHIEAVKETPKNQAASVVKATNAANTTKEDDDLDIDNI